MNLAQSIKLYIPELVADADAISQAVRKVFSKKTGKGKGNDAISGDISETVRNEAENILGEPLNAQQLSEIDDFIDQRLGYLKTTFKTLDAPMKDKSDERAALVGKTEDSAATWFGRTKGYEWGNDPIMKAWTCVDPCTLCADNEAEGPIPVGEIFPSGDYAPPGHPECQCYLLYETEDGDPA